MTQDAGLINVQESVPAETPNRIDRMKPPVQRKKSRTVRKHCAGNVCCSCADRLRSHVDYVSASHTSDHSNG